MYKPDLIVDPRDRYGFLGLAIGYAISGIYQSLFGETPLPVDYSPPTHKEQAESEPVALGSPSFAKYTGQVGPAYTKYGRRQIDPIVASYDSFFYSSPELRQHSKQPLQVWVTHPPPG